VALFRVLLQLREELGLVLAVVHVNHQIRGADANADQHFAADLARSHRLSLHAFSVDTPGYASERRLSLEAAARELRYQRFQCLLAEGILDKVATAHTLDDQAETVLLRLGRGTGVKGLAGIYPKWLIGTPVAQGERSSPSLPAIVRPLLQVRRGELEAYLRSLGQSWREDASNLDLHFARNRVRHRVLPALESELNPRVRELLADTAEIARGEEDYWSRELARAVAVVWTTSAGGKPTVNLPELFRFHLALRRRLLRAVTESIGLSLEFQHVEELLALALAPPSGEKQIGLPGGWRARRTRDRLEFELPGEQQTTANNNFTYPIPCPGEVVVAETGTVFRATVGPISANKLGQAYDPARVSGPLQVRNWRPGDRFWPNHTRAPKKIKELLQERKIPPAQRRTWPVVTIAASGGEQIIWLRGFPPPQEWLPVSGQEQALVIEECALQEAAPGAK
jgi:tRNA(Ile)-lysidine synthase